MSRTGWVHKTCASKKRKLAPGLKVHHTATYRACCFQEMYDYYFNLNCFGHQIGNINIYAQMHTLYIL